MLAEGVIEEIIYRWGLMSVVARILHREMAMDPSDAMVLAIILSALASSLAHSSDLARLKFNHVGTAFMTLMALHFWAALCYGWMFWQYGLTAAMLSHMLVVFIVWKGRELASFFMSLEAANSRL